MMKCDYLKKLMIIFIFFFTFGTQSCVTGKSISEQIKSRNPEVTRIQLAKGVGGRRLEYISLGIYLNNGGRIFLDNLQYQREQTMSRLFIIGIGEFQVHSSDINTRTASWAFSRQIPVLVIAQELKIDIQNFDDIIKNYDIIYEYVKFFPMFETYKDGYGYGKRVPFNEDGENYLYYLYKSMWDNEKYESYVVNTFNFTTKKT